MTKSEDGSTSTSTVSENDAITGEWVVENTVLGGQAQTPSRTIVLVAQDDVGQTFESVFSGRVTIEVLPDGEMPTKANESDAAYDIHSAERIRLLPMRQGGVHLVGGGFKLDMPKGIKANILPRSGLSTKGIMIANAPGTIDASYNKEVKVALYNLTDKPFWIHKGDRIAQMDFQSILPIILEGGKVDDSGRGGFGSTGV